MLLLAADTSGKHGSIALAHCTPEAHASVIEVVPLDGGTFSAQLVPQISALLAKHGFSKRDIGGFAVVSGPGSFTGLRIGLAAIKALGRSSGQAYCRGVSAGSDRRRWPSAGQGDRGLDAGRGEVYAGEYRSQRLRSPLDGERLLTRIRIDASRAGSVVLTARSGLGRSWRAMQDCGWKRSNFRAAM